jgi:hypothetical protein
MRKLALLLLCLPTAAGFGQVGPVNGFCEQGGTTAAVSGLQSTNNLQGIVPNCTVSVYYTGTSTLVPNNSIFRDTIGTVLGNPFTASASAATAPGQWLFYAAFQGYDVVLSGGTSPNVYPQPVTIPGLVPYGGNGGTVNGTVSHLGGFSPSATSLLAADALTAQINGNKITCADPLGLFYSGTNCGLSGTQAESSQDSTTSATGRSALAYYYQSQAGGSYSYNGSTGSKSDRFPFYFQDNARTVAQNEVLTSYLNAFSGGEGINFSAYTNSYHGYNSAGQEWDEGYRFQWQQPPASQADGSGGVWEAVQSGAITGGVVPFAAPTNNWYTLAEQNFIRDLGNSISVTYTGVSCTGTGPTTCTITFSGTFGGISWGSNPHTTWSNLAGGGPITSNDAVFCAAPGANNGYDLCVPITNATAGSGGTGTITVNLEDVGVQSNASWVWPTSGSGVIYGSAWPVAVSSPGTAAAAGTFTAGGSDVSGIVPGHTLDQVLAYNGGVSGINGIVLRDIGFPNTGDGINIVNLSPAAAPPLLGGIMYSGPAEAAFMEGANGTYGTPYATLWANHRPASVAYATIYDVAAASTALFNAYALRYSDNVVRGTICIDPNMANDDTVQIYCPPNATPAVVMGKSGSITAQGNVSAAGSISSSYGGVGPYNVVSHDSTFQTVPATTYWSTYNNSGCTGSPNPFTSVTADAVAGPYDSGSTTSAMAAVTPATFGGSGCTYIGQKQTVSMVNGAAYTLVAWVKSSAPASVTVGYGDSTCLTCAILVINATTAGQWVVLPGTYATSTNQVYWWSLTNSVTVSVFEEIQATPSPFVISGSTLPSGIGSISAGIVQSAGENVVAFSATPTFSTAAQLNTITLTGNVTSSTLAVGNPGQAMRFVICQDSTGSRTFTWPTNVHGGMTIGSTLSTCSAQDFVYSANKSLWYATGQGATNE